MRPVFTLATIAVLSTPAFAQVAPPPPPMDQPPPEEAPEAKEDEKKEPGKGDFDAGGRVRLPNGPDEMGEYATFNWVAVDLVGRYFLLDSIQVKGNIPVALVRPDMTPEGIEPSMFGGGNLAIEIEPPDSPFYKKGGDTRGALIVSGAYMREGAMLLSDKDYPLYAGDFKPGFTAGFYGRVKMSSVLDVTTAPVFVYQSGTEESLQAVQLPLALVVGIGDLVKVSADAGVYTGDGFTFRGSKGGRVAAGGALDVKIGPILAHAGAGVATLTTGPAYPTIADSFYIDLNVKYAK